MSNPYAYYKAKPAEFFHLIPQVGVTHLHCDQDPDHNAIWDMAVSPEGRIFFSACGESYLSLYARLYEYDHKQKKLIRHFALEDRMLTNPTALRTSKFHTAMSFIGGGRIFSTTHTTSPAPTHPTWMPHEYSGHPYEEYPGSMLIEYNYLTGESKSLGMISPHDTTYGGTYDPKNGDYFCIGFLRGNGYVYNVHTGSLRCLGQVSDTRTSRMFLCSDGHIYGTTFSGAFFRYNTDIRDVEYLGVNAPGLLRYAVEVDGILYFTTGTCSVIGAGQKLYSYNLKTREVSTVGTPIPEKETDSTDPWVYLNAYGMAMDSKKRLWYGVMTHVPGLRFAGTRLYMWDFLNGKDPVDCGFMGSTKQTIAIPTEMHIVNDVLYIADSNHSSDHDVACGIMAIDLDEFVPALETAPRIFSHDYINYIVYPEECHKYYPKDDFAECYARWEKYYKDTICYFNQFAIDNAFRVDNNGVAGVSVWEKVGRENAAIHSISWKDNENFTFYCGKDKTYRADCILKDGKITILKLEEASLPEVSEMKAAVPDVKLPAVPGRRYIAKAECSVKMPDGKVFVGTEDTMVGIIDGDKVFGLGQVCTGGGVHSVDCTKDGKIWGVAGHAEALGQVFTYSAQEGVVLRGIMPEAFSACGRNVTCIRPTTVALSPDNRYIAVGGANELGGVLIMDIQGK